MYPTCIDTKLPIMSDGSEYQSQNLRYAPVLPTGNVTVNLPAAVRLRMTVMTVNYGVTVSYRYLLRCPKWQDAVEPQAWL
jgi:hypothetical protein